MSDIVARKGRNEKNRSPPPSSYSTRAHEKESKPRRVRNVTTAADHAELERCYTFVPSNKSSSWQERMVNNYHSHLYKEYVLADLTRPGQVGLRWRTKTEVQKGKGHDTCGNKHCPSYKENNVAESRREIEIQLATYYRSPVPATEESELKLLKSVRHGLGLHDYEVNFAYQEGGVQKNELVKLRLCLQCAPLLFHNKGGALGAREARKAMDKGGARVAQSNKRHRDSSEEALHKTDSDDNSSVEGTKKKQKKRKKHKHRKKKRSQVSDKVPRKER